MLRDMKLLSDRAPLALRISSLIAMLVVTLAVAGIRPPGSSSPSQATAGQPLSGTTLQPPVVPDASVLEAKYVPANVFAIAVFRPTDLLPIYRQARAKIDGPVSDDEKAAIDLMGKCRTATIVVSDVNQSERVRFGVVLSFTDKPSRDAAAEMMAPNAQFRREKFLLAEIEVDGPQARYFADATTLIFGEIDTVKSMVLAGPSSLSLLTQTDAWTSSAKGTLAVAVDPSGVKTLMASAPPNPIVGMFSPLWMQADSHTLGVVLGEKAEIRLVSISAEEKNAKVIQATMNAAISMLTGMVASQKESVPSPATPAMESLETLLASQSVVRNGNQTTLTFSGDAKGHIEAIVGLLVPALSSAKQSAQRNQQTNNVKQIMLAMYNYHDSHGHFPPAVIVDAASGEKRSWRVELLPYLEHAPLYEKYRRDQPWDSVTNKAVLAEMPGVYRNPAIPMGTTHASVFAVVGHGLVFEKNDHDGTKIQEITDGTSNTVCLVGANRDIPWTKPEDVEFDSDADKLPDLGVTPEGFSAGFCDGAVRFISNNIDLTVWKNLLTRAGGEVLNGF